MNDHPNNLPTIRPQGVAGAKPLAIVATTMDEAWRMSEAMHRSGLAPKDLNSPEKVMVAVMYGAEVGLPPMAAVQSIAVMNGRPVLWGDAALGIVKSSGLCVYIKEWFDGDGDDRVYYCETQRKGDPEPVKREYSVKDAKQAGLWDERPRVRNYKGEDIANPSPWFRFRPRMMQMRARGFCIRDAYADLLKGMRLKEEVDDGNVIEGEVAATAAPVKRVPPPAPPREPNVAIRPTESLKENDAPAQATALPADGPNDASAPPPAAQEPEKPVSYSENAVKFLERFDARCAAAKDGEELVEIWMQMIDGISDVMDPPDYEQAAATYAKHERKFEP